MMNLRKKLIRLAHSNPEGIRRHLVPLLRQATPGGVDTAPSEMAKLAASKDYYDFLEGATALFAKAMFDDLGKKLRVRMSSPNRPGGSASELVFETYPEYGGREFEVTLKVYDFKQVFLTVKDDTGNVLYRDSKDRYGAGPGSLARLAAEAIQGAAL